GRARLGWRPCEKSLSQRKRAILLLLDRVIRSLRHAEARATTVNCPMSGGDPLFTRPRWFAAIDRPRCAKTNVRRTSSQMRPPCDRRHAIDCSPPGADLCHQYKINSARALRPAGDVVRWPDRFPARRAIQTRSSPREPSDAKSDARPRTEPERPNLASA